MNYLSGAEQDAYWVDKGPENMAVEFEKVLSPGQTCSYEYDFGSTTELLVKVLSEYEVDMKGKVIQILASNGLPIIPCDGCGEPATSLCTHCIYEDKGCLSDACAKHHGYNEERLLP